MMEVDGLEVAAVQPDHTSTNRGDETELPRLQRGVEVDIA